MMMHLKTTGLATLGFAFVALAACSSNPVSSLWGQKEIYVVPAKSCDTEQLSYVNGLYERRQNDLWGEMTGILFQETATAWRESDRVMVSGLENDLKMLRTNINTSYKEADQSCRAFLGCFNGTSGSVEGAGRCDALQGRMLIKTQEFLTWDQRLEAERTKVLSLSPLPAPPPGVITSEADAAPAAPSVGPSVKQSKDCPDVGAIFTVCSDRDSEQPDDRLRREQERAAARDAEAK